MVWLDQVVNKEGYRKMGFQVPSVSFLFLAASDSYESLISYKGMMEEAPSRAPSALKFYSYIIPVTCYHTVSCVMKSQAYLVTSQPEAATILTFTLVQNSWGKG